MERVSVTLKEGGFQGERVQKGFGKSLGRRAFLGEVGESMNG